MASSTTATVARRRVLPKLNTPATTAVAACFVGLLILVALAAPLLAPHDPNATDLSHSLAGSSGDYPLGQDGSGRDILSRLIYGARLSLLGPLLVVLFSVVLGVPAGLVAGFKGGAADAVISRISDLVFGFPPLLLAIVIVATFGGGFLTATVAIAITYVPLLARVVRGVVLVEVRKPYVDACRAQGFSGLRIVMAHILPNVSGTAVSQSTLNFGYALLDLAGLAFLGLGVQPPSADWGEMLSDGRANILIAPDEVIAASVVIGVTVVAFNLLGDSLADRFSTSARDLAEEEPTAQLPEGDVAVGTVSEVPDDLRRAPRINRSQP